MTYADLGVDLALVLAEHDEVRNLMSQSVGSNGDRYGVRTFSASDQGAPLAPVMFGVFCSASDMLADYADDADVADAVWELRATIALLRGRDVEVL
jgi:hypothetical protein